MSKSKSFKNFRRLIAPLVLFLYSFSWITSNWPSAFQSVFFSISSFVFNHSTGSSFKMKQHLGLWWSLFGSFISLRSKYENVMYGKVQRVSKNIKQRFGIHQSGASYHTKEKIFGGGATDNFISFWDALDIIMWYWPE